MGTTTRLLLEKLVAGASTRANLISYWNSNADILDTLIKGTGLAGGQTVYGGTALGETMSIYSTTNATKSGVLIDSIRIGRGGGGIASNTAIGVNALTANTTGTNNTAVGVGALQSNTTGHENTAVGVSTLTANTTGYYNIAIGVNALTANTTGYYNIAIGVNALIANTTGTNNTAVGVLALGSNTTGYVNTVIGYSAGSTIEGGVNLTCLGYNAQPSAVDAVNEITLGDTNIATLRCKVTTITAISDRRDKADIKDLPIGLDFIRALKPRVFKWAVREKIREEKEEKDGTKSIARSFGKQAPDGTGDIGFIAQELDEVQTKHGIDLGLVMKTNADRLEATPGRLLPVAIRAIQELAEKMDILEKRLVTKE